jgi:hypothetical protein
MVFRLCPEVPQSATVLTGLLTDIQVFEGNTMFDICSNYHEVVQRINIRLCCVTFNNVFV